MEIWTPFPGDARWHIVTVTISKAHKLIGIQTEDLMSIGGAVATKGLKYIQYLNNYWMMDAL